MKAVLQRIGPMMLALVVAAVIFIPQPGIGQLVEGTLNGYVTDPNQAAVVGPAVTVTNQATSFSRNAVTNSYDAEQGLAGGISVNITTKSGTNSIHGSLFEFHTDRAFQAYQWNANGALPKPEYINNQFGGTIGGREQAPHNEASSARSSSEGETQCVYPASVRYNQSGDESDRDSSSRQRF